MTLFGGYTQRITLPADQVFHLPDDLSMAQGAAVLVVWLTAWYALFELAHPRPGQTLLVHSAAGGAGGSIVQLGKLAGCRVVGIVGRAEKVAEARALGADEVICKATDDLWAKAKALAPQGYDVVLDATGVETLKESYAHLRRPGKLVVYGFASMMPKGGRTNWLKLIAGVLRTPRFHPLKMTNLSSSVLAFNLSYLFDQKEILMDGVRQLLGWLAEGKLQVPTVAEVPLAQVGEAHAALESGRTVGKLVLVSRP
ncbi:MAG: zinc-binding dehydrogenase [bacterium]